MRVTTASLVAVALSITLNATLQANTYGSVEPIANPDVIDTSALRNQPLRVREAFATRLLQCGVVSDVGQVLSETHAITTINNLNTQFSVGAGGFAGNTNPAYVYTVIDNGPNAASANDIKVLTDSLGYVLSQGSAFLLDADNPDGFDFPANYVVLNFDSPPSIARSAALFRTVGRIDPELFETDTSGYTQYGRAYLSLQSDVPDAQFISGYVRPRTSSGWSTRPSSTACRRCSGRRGLSRQRLDRKPAGRGVPGADSGTEPPWAGAHPCFRAAGHSRGGAQAGTSRRSTRQSDLVRLQIKDRGSQGSRGSHRTCMHAT